MNDLKSINLLMLDWSRILELDEDDMVQLRLKDQSIVTGYIHPAEDHHIPLRLPSTLAYDVIVMRRDLNGDNGEPWTIIYKNDVESLEIIRAKSLERVKG